MKNIKRVIAIAIASLMLFAAVSCGPVEYVDPYAGLDYDQVSAEIYDDILGEFAEAYAAAKAATNVSERYALMAVAEAKLMEAAVMLPLSSNGGNYAVSRVAPYTVTPVLWGNDSYRYHNAIVATEFIKSADRAEMKAKYAELKGTGTWETWVKTYLADKGYSDPETWDVLATSRAADSEAIVNTYDGLYEYDLENNLKPALAESYTVSEDGLKYTFKLKSGLHRGINHIDRIRCARFGEVVITVEGIDITDKEFLL